MSWQNELTIIVRTLINDLTEPYQFSDSRIQQVLTVSGKYVQFDVNLDHSYQIDVVNSSISPDPTEDNDSVFISLVCLKAACIIDQSIYRTKAAMEGIRAALGPATLAISGQSSAWRTMLENGPCASYEELTSHWDVKEATAIAAILSPFAGNKFDPELQNIRANNGYRNSFYNP
jgi:hypothetical protein